MSVKVLGSMLCLGSFSVMLISFFDIILYPLAAVGASLSESFLITNGCGINGCTFGNFKYRQVFRWWEIYALVIEKRLFH